jgi:hypothetical protein
MHGQSPTSTKPAGATGDLAKPLSKREKVCLRMGLERLRLDPSGLAFAAGRETLVGGKNYGAGGDPLLRFEWRRSSELFERLFLSTLHGIKTSALSSDLARGTIGNLGFRLGVGKCLPGVGVSPQNRPSVAENR